MYFYTFGVNFTKVCGRAVGYQQYSTNGFHLVNPINDPYVDGLSITYNTPRHYLWTYAAGEAESGG